MVEYAITRFTSWTTMPIVAAIRAVIAPMAATTNIAVADCSKMGNSRATMYTPAATIVAAWMRALTGVGPSIASGSQTWSGNWADLPTAPQNTSSAAIVTTAGETFSIASATSTRLNAPPVTEKITRMPTRKPRSPKRVVTNAFFAAEAAAG